MQNQYALQYEKALNYLRALDFDRAIILFYQLLDQKPLDTTLIEQIYSIEIGRRSSPKIQKICCYIFALDSMSSKLTPLVVQAVDDYKRHVDPLFNLTHFNRQQIFNLFYHLRQRSDHLNTDTLYEEIKNRYPEDALTAQCLFHFCENLVARKQIIRARKELKYLLTYYAETDIQQAAQGLLKTINL